MRRRRCSHRLRHEKPPRKMFSEVQKTKENARNRYLNIWVTLGCVGVRTPYLRVPGLRPRPLGQAARLSTLWAVASTTPAPLAPGLPFVVV